MSRRSVHCGEVRPEAVIHPPLTERGTGLAKACTHPHHAGQSPAIARLEPAARGFRGRRCPRPTAAITINSPRSYRIDRSSPKSSNQSGEPEVCLHHGSLILPEVATISGFTSGHPGYRTSGSAPLLSIRQLHAGSSLASGQNCRSSGRKIRSTGRSGRDPARVVRRPSRDLFQAVRQALPRVVLVNRPAPKRRDTGRLSRSSSMMAGCNRSERRRKRG